MAPLFADSVSSQSTMASLDVGVVRETQQAAEFAPTQEHESMVI